MTKLFSFEVLQNKLDQKFGSNIVSITNRKQIKKGSLLTVKCNKCSSLQKININKFLKSKIPCSCLRFEKNTKKLKKSRIVTKENYQLEFDKKLLQIVEAYKDILKIDTKKSISTFLDKNTSYNHFKNPLPFSIICHPANIHQTKKKSLSLSKLNIKIRQFEKKYGVVHFPDSWKQTFAKEKPKVKNVRILGLDPGTQNFGVFGGIFSGKNQLEQIQFVLSKNLQNPIHNLIENFSDTTLAFREEIKLLLSSFNPDIIVIERFQVRSSLHGTSAEVVSFLIGIIYELAFNLNPKIEFKLVIAAQWKNAVNRIYKDYLTLFPSLDSRYYHRLDAFLMSIYAYPLSNSYLILKKYIKQIRSLVEK